MSMGFNQQDTPDLLSYLLAKFQFQPLPEGNQPAPLSELDLMYQQAEGCKTKAEAAAMALAVFVQFCQAYLMEYQPVQMVAMTEGFGVQLNNQDVVSLTIATLEPGELEDAGDIPVTFGRSQRGQKGVTNVNAIHI